MTIAGTLILAYRQLTPLVGQENAVRDALHLVDVFK